MKCILIFKVAIFLCFVLFNESMAQVNLHVAHGGGLSEVDFSSGYSGPASAFISLTGAEVVVVDENDVIHVGHADGISALVYNEGGKTYSDATPSGAFLGPIDIDNLAIDADGVIHIMHTAGLSGLNFDHGSGAGTGYSDTTAFLSLPAPNYGVAVDAGDVIHTGHSGGMSAVNYNPPSTYSSPASQYFAISNVRAVRIDSDDVIHVGHIAGLSALTYNGSNYVNTTHFFSLANVNAIFEDPSGDLLVAHNAGISAFSYGGSGYTARPGYNDLSGNAAHALVMDIDNVLHVGHDAGISAFTYDSGTGQFTDTGFFISVSDVRSIGLKTSQEVPVELMYFTVQ